MANLHTPDTVKTQMQADIAASNAKTGATDTTLHDAVNRLIDGFGSGGGGGVTPTGTLDIYENGKKDVALFAEVNVQVPNVIPDGYLQPTGTKDIISNGVYDVAKYASANVNVPVPEQITEVRTITLPSVTGSGQQTTIYTADEFVKKHYSNNGFSITMYPVTTFDASANDVLFIYHTNKNVGSNGVTRTGAALKASSATAASVTVCSARIDAKGYNIHFRADSTGKLTLYTASGYNIKAGQYVLVMTCAQI